jgi:hypothetical protein
VSGRRRSNPRTVAARLLAILDSFSPGHLELSLVEISRRTGLASSTTHRLVGELHAWGALERGEDLRYRIGPRLRELAAVPDAVSARRAETDDRRPDGTGLGNAATNSVQRAHRVVPDRSRGILPEEPPVRAGDVRTPIRGLHAARSGPPDADRPR